MKRRLVQWGERYFYAPSLFQRLLSLLLFPLSALYCAVMALRYRFTAPVDPGIPVISIGNLTVGGSGKTPLTVALASPMARPAIVLRGYGRKSSGLRLVSDGERICCDVETSGDEAMLYATLLPQAVVLVSEEREAGIGAARELGCECVFLDDGYGKHRIAKYDIVIEVGTPNRFCLPSGPYREKLWRGKQAVTVREGRDFVRRVRIEEGAERMALVTAIARPERLDAYLPEGVVAKRCFPDHHYFTRGELEAVLRESGAERLLVTYKDYVKIRHFNLPLARMALQLELTPELAAGVARYIKEYDENEN